MAITDSALICVIVLISVCSSVHIPDEDLSHANAQDAQPTERCAGRKNWRLRNGMTLDLSAIHTEYMDSLMEAGVTSRSLSQWEFRLNSDPDRFPFVISEADCFTFSCLDSEGNEDPNLMSYPIQNEMMVLRRQQRECDYTYSLETEVVTVGCTCVRSLYTHYYY